MRDTMRATSLGDLPEHIRHRIVEGLAPFTDAAWYCGYTKPDLLAVRIGDLLRSGMLWPDCEWLITTGLLAPFCRHADTWRQDGALNGAELTEQTRVELTEAGEAALHNAMLHPVNTSHHGKEVLAGAPRSPLLYCAERRELFVADVSVLRLATNADNMEAILRAFQKRHWKRSIACPFKDLSNGHRSRTVRDAVFGLNHGQQPLRVVFHSRGKGAEIWYALAHESSLNGHANYSPPPLPR